MSKLKIYLFYIFTFGIGYFILKSKAKKQANSTNDKLITTNKIPFELEDFFSALGGKNNIIKSSATISSIKIIVNNIELIKQDDLEKMGSKGQILSEDAITCLFGDFSQSLNELINLNK